MNDQTHHIDKISSLFTIQELIGEGNVSVVLRAIDRTTGTDVALKILRREHVQDAGRIRAFNTEIECLRAMKGSQHVIEMLANYIDHRQGHPPWIATEFAQYTIDHALLHIPRLASIDTAASLAWIR